MFFAEYHDGRHVQQGALTWENFRNMYPRDTWKVSDSQEALVTFSHVDNPGWAVYARPSNGEYQWGVH